MEEQTCKIIVIGDSSVGKTTLIHRYVSQEYRSDFKATLGADMATKMFVHGDISIEAQIWDTAGTERFRSISAHHYRGSDICIFVFDMTNQNSFIHLDSWKNEFMQSIDVENEYNYPFVLLGNKSDLADCAQISPETAEKWATERGMKFFLVSARTGENVDKAFTYAIEKHLSRDKVAPPLKLPPPVKEEGSKCC